MVRQALAATMVKVLYPLLVCATRIGSVDSLRSPTFTCMGLLLVLRISEVVVLNVPWIPALLVARDPLVADSD